MRAIWRGSISFALVSIQVKLYPATHKRDIPFRLLHKADSTPIELKRHCPSDNAEVAWEDVVHGYQYGKGKFVVVTDEELEAIPQRASKTIAVEGFIEPGRLEPVYIEKNYFLEPEEGSERPYALLAEAVRQTGKLALARFTLKDKEHICALSLHKGTALMLSTLYYHDEIARAEELAIPRDIKLSDPELSLAKELITRFSGEFRPERYKDTYRESLMELIKARIEGRQVKMPPVVPPAKVISLMEALKKSVQRSAAKKAGKKGREKTKTAQRVPVAR